MSKVESPIALSILKTYASSLHLLNVYTAKKRTLSKAKIRVIKMTKPLRYLSISWKLSLT